MEKFIDEVQKVLLDFRYENMVFERIELIIEDDFPAKDMYGNIIGNIMIWPPDKFGQIEH